MESGKPGTALDCLLEKGDPNQLISNRYKPASPGGGKPFLNRQAKGILGFLEGVRNRVLDQRFYFLYNPGPYNPDLEGKVERDLNCLLEEWLGHEKIVTILDLSGVPPEIMDKVFEPFFTTKKVGKGTGLGLSISYGIIKECGGSIKVRAGDPEGACFILVFPVMDTTT